MRSRPLTWPAMRRRRVVSLRFVSGDMGPPSGKVYPTPVYRQLPCSGVTQRKPPELSVAGWVEQQIQEAQRAGRFDDLPGSGRPLDAADAADPLWWAKQLLRREHVDALPPAL